MPSAESDYVWKEAKSGTKVQIATMAQLVEQRIRNAWVPGSSPGSGSKRTIH